MNNEKLKRFLTTIVLGMIMSSFPAKAQSGFFYGVDAASSNLWTGTGLLLVETLIQACMPDNVATPVFSSRYTYEIMKFTDDNERILFNSDDRFGWKRVYGFKAKDLLGHIVSNAKIGWMGAYSPIGAYLHFGYDYRRFSMRLSYQEEAQNYRIGTFNPGIGIRISPSNFFNSYSDCKLILEIGTNYNVRNRFKGPYDNDKSQLNNSISYVASIGVDFSNLSLLLGAEWFKNDLFNKKFTPDNGLFYPYYNLSSRITTIFLSVNYGF